jgi:CRISPR-associated protein Cas2
MLIISYDISDDRVRARFARFLEKFGTRLQYSIFEIKNSPRILNSIRAEIKNKFEKQFGEEDSVMIFLLSKQCKIERYGYAKHDEETLIIV